jgi:DNA-binding NarL/FixJ family response regulator
MTTVRPYRVIVVDDHTMVLDAITSSLARRDEFEVAGRARSVDQAIDLLKLSTVDVLVTDLHLEDGIGTDLVTYASRLNPPVPVLLITGSDGRNAVDAALASGCAGFVSKADGFERLVDALLAVARGAAVFPAALLSASLVRVPARDHSLSARELEVLQLLANALSVPVIAERLHLSTHTVRNHVKQILTKLDAHTQLEAVVIAARSGIVELR